MSRSPLVGKLSDLTSDVVDKLYGIDTAVPQDKPTIVLLVGAPGVGKSSGHTYAIEKGYIPAEGYVTINLDTLLESLLPFRAGSALGYALKQKYPEDVKLSSIQSYQSKKENLGAFGWYDDDSETKGRGAAKVTTVVEKARSKILKNKDSAAVNIEKANSVRALFNPLKDVVTAQSLIDLNEEALGRAIAKSVPIIYETTLSLSKKTGNVEKFEKLIALLEEHGSQYRVVVLHLTGEPAEVAERMNARQKYEMPYDPLPFYRYVPPSLAEDQIKDNNDAVDAIRRKYASSDMVIVPDAISVAMNRLRLPAERNNAIMGRVLEVYGPAANINSLANRMAILSLNAGKEAAVGGAGASNASAKKGGARRRSRRRSIKNHRRRNTTQKKRI